MRECKAAAAAAPLPGRRAGASRGAALRPRGAGGTGGHRHRGGRGGEQRAAGRGCLHTSARRVPRFCRSRSVAPWKGLKALGFARFGCFPRPPKENGSGGKRGSRPGCGARPRSSPPAPRRAGPGAGGGSELCLLRKVKGLYSSPTAIRE